jgi:hypothetical protein
MWAMYADHKPLLNIPRPAWAGYQRYGGRPVVEGFT